MLRQPTEQYARYEHSRGLLLHQLQEIWSEMGKSEDERGAEMAEIEKECLAAYRRKVDEACRSKADLLKAIAMGRAEIAAIGSSMGGPDIHSNNRVGENLKEELENVNLQLGETRKKKMERKKCFDEVLDQLLKISFQLGNPTDYLRKLAAEEADLSLQKLEELRRELVEIKNQKSKRQDEVEDYLDKLNSLCSVLGEDFKDLISGIHASLVDSKEKDVSSSTLKKLALMIENLHEVKLQRMQKVQDLAVSLLELWNLLNTPMEEQNRFNSITRTIALSESEITETDILSVASIKRAEEEVTRLSKLKTTKIKELIFTRKIELEDISRKMHMATEDAKLREYLALESTELGVKNPEQLLGKIDHEIAKVKEEASSRKEILERVEKWTAACEEESWLEEYNRDDNRYNAGRGAHLTLKRAEKARILVNKLPAMVEALMVKVTVWEKDRGIEFLYDGVRLLSMLEQYTALRQEKELEKQRQRDLKKLQGQLIAEQETLYGSKPSPTKSGKKLPRTPGAAHNRKLSLGGAMLQSIKPDKMTTRAFASRKSNYSDQNATPRHLLSSVHPTPSGRRYSEIPSRLGKKHHTVAGKPVERKSPLMRKPLSPVPSNIVNSPEDRIVYNKSLEREENRRTPTKPVSMTIPVTPAASVAMTEVNTPATPALAAKTLEKRVDVDVEYSFEEVRAGFPEIVKPVLQA